MAGVGRFGWVTDPGATESNCGSPPDRVFTQAVTCRPPARLPGCEPWLGPRGRVPLRLLRVVTGTPGANLGHRL
jgi:hypothetical protein